MSYNQVTVSSETTLVLAANANRHSFVIENLGDVDLYLGQDTDLTTATGIALITNGSFTDESTGAGKCWPGAVYGTTVSSTTLAAYWEEVQ